MIFLVYGHIAALQKCLGKSPFPKVGKTNFSGAKSPLGTNKNDRFTIHKTAEIRFKTK